MFTKHLKFGQFSLKLSVLSLASLHLSEDRQNLNSFYIFQNQYLFFKIRDLKMFTKMLKFGQSSLKLSKLCLASLHLSEGRQNLNIFLNINVYCGS